MDVKAGLRLCRSQTPEDMFSSDEVQLVWLANFIRISEEQWGNDKISFQMCEVRWSL